ncbi:hypothetical protein HCJ46_07110 [Listeria booriae]|nr:hypothetical protein [Listeria booriae]MBC2206026.1 hypothetical protein [Listeria booriae]
MEYTNGKFEVYMTGERPSVSGKSGFEDFGMRIKSLCIKYYSQF